MLKHTASFKQEQQRILKEICREIPNVEGVIKDYEEKIVKLKKLLPLMRAIEKLSQKEKETPEEINSFNKMIAMYEEQTILLAQSENINQTVKVHTSSNSSVPMPPVIYEKAPEQIVNKGSFLQQIQEAQLKPVAKNKVEKKPAPMDKKEKGSPVFVINPNDLAGVKLKSVDPKNSVTLSHDEKKPTEYEKKFAEIQAYNKEINNIVPSQTNDKSSEKWENLLDVLCNDYLTAAKEFIERPNRSLSLIQDSSESRPTSMMFDKTLRPFQTDLSALEQNKPVIVGGIPKLKV
ncbi:hypothetical protein [Rickettsiella endosymbiont of Aleochara curtula]|uniref:hypothetical protein n=1 Tax=Rickettsiella endosymbiont of Aleochara curtula TaxID=3077936 RepID=UPI00313B4C88